MKKTRAASQRDLVKTPGAARYAKRTASGQFKETDDVGRSAATDRTRKAKTSVRSGFGDQGDQRQRRLGAKKR